MQTKNTSTRRLRRPAGIVLMVLVAVMLFGSAAAKFAHVAPVVSQLAAFGLAGNRLLFVAILEALSSLLFLIPATRSAGLLLVSSFLGGAIATHLQHGESIAGPSIVLVLMWLGAWLRHPQILWSFGNTRANSPYIGQGSRFQTLS